MASLASISPFSSSRIPSNNHKKFEIFLKPLFDPNLTIQHRQQEALLELNQSTNDSSNLEAIPLPKVQPNKFMITHRRSTSVQTNLKQAEKFRQDSKGSFNLQERLRSRNKEHQDLEPLKITNYREKGRGHHLLLRRNISNCNASIDNDQDLSDLSPGKNETFDSPLNGNFGDTNYTFEQSHRQSEKLIDFNAKKVDNLNVVLPKIQPQISAKDFVFDSNTNEHIYKKHALSILQGIKYATKQVKPPALSQISSKQVLLDKKNPALKKTLVLDLDETLVTTKISVTDNLPVLNGNENNSLRMKIRPYAEQFLKEMSKEFEIIIFTAAEKNYAETLIRKLDPNQKYISHILHRQHCLKTKKGLFIKDLRIIQGRELKDMVLVDNFTPSFSFQINNGIPIVTWEGDQKDQELKYLMDYLLKVKTYDDMRECNKERFYLEELSSFSTLKIVGL